MTESPVAESSQSTGGTPDMRRLPPDAHIGRVRLRVADLERSLGFYRDLLGMRLIRIEGATATLAAGEEGSADAGALIDGPNRTSAPADSRELLVLYEMPGIARRPQRPVTTGLYHIAFLVPSRRALGQALLGLHYAGYPLRGASDHGVSESLYLDDPDGNGLEIYADRTRSAWQWRDGMVYMTTEPMNVESVLAAAADAGTRTTPWPGLPHETAVGHVHFTVSHLERALAFYRDVVGFDEVARIPPRLVGVSVGGYHHHVNLNTWAGDGAPPDSTRVAGLLSWELVVPGAEPRQALVDRLAAAGARVADTAAQIMARDPDGITLEVQGAERAAREAAR
jgi:catechol 2,3-dioxygenase